MSRPVLHHEPSRRNGCSCNDYESMLHSGRKSVFKESYAVPDGEVYRREVFCSSGKQYEPEEDSHDNFEDEDDNAEETCCHCRKQWLPKKDVKNTIMTIRQKACRLIDSDSVSESSEPRCKCCTGGSDSGLMRKAKDLLDYSPKSSFLRNLKRRSQDIENYDARCDCNHCRRRSSNEVEEPRVSSFKERQDLQREIERERHKNMSRAEEIAKENVHVCNCSMTAGSSQARGSVKSKDKSANSTARPTKKGNGLRPGTAGSRKPAPARKEPCKPRPATAGSAIQGNKVCPCSKSGCRCSEIGCPCAVEVQETKARPEPESKKPQRQARPRERKPRSAGGNKCKCIPEDEFDPNFAPTLKRPYPNSCERCFRYASPSRSPPNKPEQRYDPNFRRAHNCEESSKADIHSTLVPDRRKKDSIKIDRPRSHMDSPSVDRRNKNSTGRRGPLQELKKSSLIEVSRPNPDSGEWRRRNSPDLKQTKVCHCREFRGANNNNSANSRNSNGHQQKYMVNERLFSEPVSSNNQRNRRTSDDKQHCRCRRASPPENEYQHREDKSKGCHCRDKEDRESNPMKYSVFYMTKNKEKGDEDEVLIEELKKKVTQKNGKFRKKDTDSKLDTKKKEQFRPDSMALSYQKGVNDKSKRRSNCRVSHY